MDGNKKSSKGTINNGKGWCRPAQQGLVRKLTEILHLETCGMQPRGLEGRAQHGHSSGAHSTPGDQCCGCQRDGQVVVWWWVDGGVSSGTSLYRCMHTCRIQCQQSTRLWLHSGGARPHGSQRHQS